MTRAAAERRKIVQYNDIKQFHFSATGTTQKIVQEIGQVFDAGSRQRDLLREPLDGPTTVGADSLAIVGMPVYGGRIPAHCADMLKNLKGTNSPAIAVVVYGNRDYDDALLELRDILRDNGFLVFAAGAFVARHSMLPRVAETRPDQSDLRAIAEFSRQCGAKLKRMTGEEEAVPVKGEFPYKQAVGVPLRPSADKRCTACGVCANVCPTAAISKEAPPSRDKKRCISCAACVTVCPERAMDFRGIPYRLFEPILGWAFRARREPQTFL